MLKGITRTGMVTVAVFCLAMTAFSQVDAGHVYQDTGSCSGPSVVVCRTNWPGPNGQPMNIRTIDQFSGSAWWWLAPATSAGASWHNSAGPQNVSYSPQSNDSWVYQKYGWTGYGGLAADSLAINYNCTMSGSCSTPGVNTHWSEEYFNRDQPEMQNGYPYLQQAVFAHELGHAFGLKHHDGTLQTIMRPILYDAEQYSGRPNGPLDPTDIGTLTNPPCTSATGNRGIRCIYRWTIN